ncbi:MAG TPA: type II toxin-antitoxin system VapC family toxin [Nitrososphaerales archaeon]|nr:type II toxin-antitoxin system VapC family toxin [Nitrososphaerales archaeon]
MRFVDANVFVYHMQEDPLYSKKTAHTIVKRIDDGEEAATSTLVIAQVCGYMKWKRRADLIPVFLTFLRSLPSLSKIHTLFSDFVEANNSTRVEARGTWTKWDDFAIAAQMQRLGMKEIYSNDRHFDSIPSMRRIFQ